MRILVTGACGFIGSNFVHYWTQAHPGDHLVALDLLTYAGVRENLAGLDVAFVHGDIGDLDLVSATMREHRVDVVVNFAAETHNSRSVLDPGLFVRTNVLATQRLLQGARDAGVERFHHISTDEVFGQLELDSDAKFNEEWPYAPRTPYAASKAGGDHVVRSYHETFGLPVTLTNCANNYGRYQFPEKVLPLFLTNALDDRPLPMYASTQNRREWLHVTDHCRAIDMILDQGRVGETYCVGAPVEKSIEELADAVLEVLGKPKSLKMVVPDRPGHDARYAIDWTKINRELGWEPTISFEDGLADTARWYADHRDWWEPLRSRAKIDESAWGK